MLADERNRRIAVELIRIVHECDAGMKQGVVYYRAAVASNNSNEAAALLKRAARLPYRVEARISSIIDKFGRPAIAAAVNKVSGMALSDLISEIDRLKTYSDSLKTARASGATLTEIADDIDANRMSVDMDETLPIPQSYTDTF